MSRAITLRWALIALLAASIIPTAVGIGVVSYLNSRESANALWSQLADEISDVAIEKTLRYVEAGRAQVLLHRRLTDAGDLQPADREATLRFLAECVQAQPSVTWCSFAGVDGAYLAGYKEPPDDKIRITWREVTDAGTRYRDYYDSDGTWMPIWDKLGDYDPRTRPWWPIAQKATEPTWAPPVLFASRKQPGVMLTLRQDGPDGQMIGAWQMEYELSYLARFLSSMEDEFARGGLGGVRVYLVTDQDVVVGHARGTNEREVGWTTAERDGELGLARATDHRDALLGAAYGADGRRDLSHKTHYDFDAGGESYLAAYAPFPPDSGLRWGVFVVAPADSVLGPVYENNRNTAIIALVVAAVVILVGVYVTGRMTRRLATLASDLDRMGRLELERADGDQASKLAEINAMYAARDRMAGGLRSFAKYVPAALVRDLMHRGQEAVLGGEMKELSVFFSDVESFTTIAEQLGPARLVDSLGEYLEEMSKIVQNNRGTVDKFIGDAIMAFWGAPANLDDHAAHACAAAIECQQRLVLLRARWRDEDRPAFRARIGINTGPTVVGNIGAAHRMNYTVMGDTVNVASRLEGLCKVYGVDILVGEGTHDSVGAEFAMRPLDKVAVKGKELGLLVYELCGLRSDATDADLAFIDAYRAALTSYLARDFARAAGQFGNCLDLRPSDVASQVLGERARSYAQAPPPERWSGVYVVPHK